MGVFSVTKKLDVVTDSCFSDDFSDEITSSLKSARPVCPVNAHIDDIR